MMAAPDRNADSVEDELRAQGFARARVKESVLFRVTRRNVAGAPEPGAGAAEAPGSGAPCAITGEGSSNAAASSAGTTRRITASG